jgi:hypothetical protein
MVKTQNRKKRLRKSISQRIGTVPQIAR